MLFLQETSRLFSATPALGSLVEDWSSVTASYLLKNLEHSVSVESLRSHFSKLPEGDIANVKVFIGEEDIGFSSTKLDELEDNLSTLNAYHEDASPETSFHIQVTISKSFDSQGCLSVYSTPDFVSGLRRYPLRDLLALFSVKLAENKVLRFRALDCLNEKWGTNAIYFNGFVSPGFDREAVLAKQTGLVNFADASAVRLTPYDFYLTERPKNPEICDIFDEILKVTSLLAIANSCCFSDDDGSLVGQFQGARSLRASVGLRDESAGSSNDHFKLCSWIYSGGECSDKIGLARNIISLANSFRIDENVINSVCSGYEIYLKENVSRYIDLKNRISDFLENSRTKFDDKAESMTKTFAASLVAIITFFITVVIVRSGSGKGFEGFITQDVLYLTFGFIAISVIFLIAANIGIVLSRGRFRDTFERLRRRYQDLLAPDDLEKVISKEEDLDPILKSCTHRQIVISLSWIVTLVIIGTVVLYLHSLPTAPQANSSSENTKSGVQTNPDGKTQPSSQTQP